MNDKIDFLKQNLPFSALSDDVLEGIAAVLQEIYHKKNTLIFQQEATKMKGVEIIVNGEFESFFYDAKEQKRAVELQFRL